MGSVVESLHGLRAHVHAGRFLYKVKMITY